MSRLFPACQNNGGDKAVERLDTGYNARTQAPGPAEGFQRICQQNGGARITRRSPLRELVCSRYSILALSTDLPLDRHSGVAAGFLRSARSAR